jgi:choline dehydrogenase
MAGFLEATLAAGHPFSDDLNDPDAVGIGLYPQNRRGRLRISTNLAYLGPARTRPNLTVRGDVRVDHVVLENDRAVGVEAGGEMVAAREVVLCAGAPLSPALLLRSGIGPAEELGRVGVPQCVELPGVGSGLIDQPGAAIPVVPRGEVGEWPRTQLAARLAGFPGHPPDHAFYLSLFTGMAIPELSRMVGAPILNLVMVGDMRIASRGRMWLRSRDPADLPAVNLQFYSADGDLERMRAAYRHAWHIANHAAFTATVDRFALVDDDLIGDDERLGELLVATTNSRWNLVGGCPMGPDDDPLAVVDQHCRVRGVECLRVVDASVIPVPIRAPAALTCMMLGEHVSPWVAQGR